jgi:predicted DNA-binding transcriptional regulator AlpA
MKPPFDDDLAKIADSMGIALYQRFSVDEASLFLRCLVKDVKRLQQQGKLDYIQVTDQKIEFFGYQLLEYLLNSTSTHRHSPSPTPSDMQDRIIRSKEVLEKTGLSRTTIWRLEKTGEFPRRVSLGGNMIGWRLSEINRWIEKR